MIVGLLLRLQDIGTVSYSFDEASSWKTIQFSWGEMIDSVSRNVHPPLFYVILKSWAYVFGDGPVALRLCSVLFGVLTIFVAVVFVLEANRSNEMPFSSSAMQCATFAAALFALSPIHIALSLQARMYTLGSFLTVTVALYTLRIYRGGGTLAQWACFCAATLALSLTHYYGLFTVAAYALVLLVRAFQLTAIDESREALKPMLIGLLVAPWVIAVAWRPWLPVFLSQRSQVDRVYWISDFTWGDLVSVATIALTGPQLDSEAVLPSGVCAVAAILIVALAAWIGGPAGRIAVTGAVVPVLAAVTVSWNGQSIILWRYFLLAQTCVLLAWAIFVFRQRSMVLRAALVFVSIAWFGYWSYTHCTKREYIAEQSGLRQAGTLLNDWRKADEPIIVSVAHFHPIIQRYAESSGNIFVVDRGAEYLHYSGGPLFRKSEYRTVNSITHRRLFVVEGRHPFDDVNVGWREVRSQLYLERLDHHKKVVVREMERVESVDARGGESE